VRSFTVDIRNPIEHGYRSVLLERTNRTNPRNMQEAAEADLVVLERQDGSWEIWKDRWGKVKVVYPSRKDAPSPIVAAVEELA
jgi:hypothetical protein